jgi:hypothetical protein
VVRRVKLVSKGIPTKVYISRRDDEQKEHKEDGCDSYNTMMIHTFEIINGKRWFNLPFTMKILIDWAMI